MSSNGGVLVRRVAQMLGLDAARLVVAWDGIRALSAVGALVVVMFALVSWLARPTLG